jgi:hypothetical protein
VLRAQEEHLNYEERVTDAISLRTRGSLKEQQQQQQQQQQGWGGKGGFLLHRTNGTARRAFTHRTGV